MLLTGYTKKIFRAECNPGFQSLHCIAHLHQNIEAVLPFLNSALGGYEYLQSPPAVTFKVSGKLICVSGEQIAVNALHDEQEAETILTWMQKEINSAWENQDTIEPCFTGTPKPNIIEILKTLPKTNCRKCKAPTCLVFATQIAEGAKSPVDCPEMDQIKKQILEQYMATFPITISGD